MKYKVPKALSEGEETLALHLDQYRIPYEREVCLIPGRKWACDFYFRDRKLVVEVDGGTRFGKGRHSQGEGYENDCRKLNALSLAGFQIIRFTTSMVKSAEALDTIRQVLGI